MARVDPIGGLLLLFLCAIGFGVSLYTVSQEELGERGRSRLLLLCLEIGAVGGLGFWFLLRITGFGKGAGIGLAALMPAVVTMVIWAVVAWPFTAWRLERAAELPSHRSYDVTTKLCLVTLLLFFIISSAFVVLSYL